ncbi:phosphoribosylanthranilate isomerase [Nitrosococcus oceani ATCC 19707]|uniref:N-(5'-phosphoribosyl)anthranilate isomerase n=2 Tax=Nitrosococcus oceani TaxID=1229 RepID=TRPF_NITOC|nr:phosphoribosylanthranilate isomerase [Nitrosococcus oceani]Q3JCB9.1 RecName: Full=N-(5'-phosphoribosyl)anthranilate isomerase; Short=PRAI [Nitrosococcus oceani ATCC 19707]ABA57527.1 phosphoribosylanthranilate isomerase [Nitrosococcus oceani ATCC 19707]EDZ68372.1 N-(5'phosphoribosyl)anthranilate isomerase [Nitrosococcus oceani AFC27]KFI20027.1 N-(5'-phosphoribosyl)anthranilate isomerase [Nitrosococcus oceani C-27]
MRTRVKFCGITRREDAIQAIRLGADAIGLVFYPESPRAVSPQQAYQIVRELPPFVTVVGLFVNAASCYLQQILDKVPIDILQFHGEESPEECGYYGRSYIKAIRMAEGVDLPSLARSYESASALLLDAYQAGVPGGTGRAFDWRRIPKNFSKAVILAGGLTPENIAQAVRQVRPYAVDVSGGVERIKGVKDAAKMAAFMRGVDSVN